MNNLKENYENAANSYLKAFCEKHGYDYNDAYWIGGDVGEVVDVGDYCIDMTAIRTDIDHNAPEEEFVRWYDYCLRLCGIDYAIPAPSFKHWLMGCPVKSDEEIQALELLCHNVEQAKALLRDSIESEFKTHDNDR